MKNPLLRVLMSAILLALVCATVVAVTGWRLGWKTPTQFSDGFFFAGAILILVGFVSFQGYRQRPTDWPPLHLDPADRFKLWAADIAHGKNLMIFFGISGLLLFGLSLLVLRWF